jgi:GNAT superfamily N-acetyltransferase
VEPHRVTIELLPPSAAGDPALVADLCDRVNRVYAVAEEGMWREGATRIGRAEIEASLRSGQIAVARCKGRIVGSVRFRQLDSRTGEFGLLVADPEHRGIGVGRELVRFAEGLARARGLTRMQLELLVPRDWTHPTKQFLHEWYSRLGYRVVGRRDFTADDPRIASLLATAVDFLVYEKTLK